MKLVAVPSAGLTKWTSAGSRRGVSTENTTSGASTTSGMLCTTLRRKKSNWPGTKLNRFASRDDECAAAGNHLQIFIAGLVKVRRHRPVNPEQARTGRRLVGEAHVEQHGFGAVRKPAG